MEFCKKFWNSEDEEVYWVEVIGLHQTVDSIEDIELEEALSSRKNRKPACAHKTSCLLYTSY